MSTAEKTKPAKTGPLRGGLKLSVPSKNVEVLAIGGPPRVSLLPPEVLGRKKARKLRRRLGLGLVGVIVVVAAAMALTSVAMFAAQKSMTNEQNRASDLASQQAKFGAVTKSQIDSQAIKAAQKTATLKEIAWQPYIAELQKTLTKGMSITAVDGSIDPDVQASATTIPLQGPRIATLKVTVSTQQAPISDWLISLQKLTGFVDATPGSVALEDGSYTVNVTIHISDAALANRYNVKK
jgi:Tfp pilus assembly protein PilN